MTAEAGSESVIPANAFPLSSFPRKRESIVNDAKVDPRLRGDDKTEKI